MTRAVILCLLLLVSLAQAEDILSLTVAARRGDLEAVRALVRAGMKPNVRDVNGSTALHAAARGGRLKVMEFLLSVGVEPDIADRQGRRPLYEAATSGSVECCRLLVERGAELENPTVGGWTPLTAALYWGSDEVTDYLLGLGAKLNLDDDIPLLVASRRGYRLTAERLLRDGAPIDERDESGRTALHFAASGGESEVIELLLAAGADPETTDELGATPFQHAAQNSRLEALQQMLPRVKKPLSALPQACSSAGPETVELLLAVAGAEEVPAGCLARAAGRNDQAAACQILALLLPCSQPNESALRAAISAGNLEALELQLQAGASPNEEIALLAAELVRPEILDALLRCGVPPPATSDVESRWARRRQLLQSTIDRYSGMRCLHPAESGARRELDRLEEGAAQILNIIRDAQ